MSDESSDRSRRKNDLDKALAALIKNTRTTKRHISLAEIAEWLEVAIRGFGSIGVVADRVGLSPKMLRQFLAFKDLSPSVQELFASRKLDSVDMVVHLRNLSPDDQECVAREAVMGNLNSADVRAICEFRKEHPKSPIRRVIDKVISTRNVRHYVIEFVVRGRKPSERDVRKRFDAVLGAPNIVSMTINGSLGKVVVNQQGRLALQRFAKANGINQAEAVDSIATGKHTV